MHRLATAALAAALLLAEPRLAASEALTLTLAQALALARERGPQVLLAGERIAEARGRLAGASLLLRENPVLEAAAGERLSDEGDTFAAAVGLHQGFEIGGQRGARVAGGEAGVARAQAARDDALRRLHRQVAIAFYAALYAEERVQLAAGGEELAAELARIAEGRHRAQDVPILDVNVSRAALARALSDRQAAEASLATALGGLGVLLGMDSAQPLEVDGELRVELGLPLADLVARASERTDLRALAAELAQAEASARLARGEAWPDLGLGARYERDDRDDVVLGEVSFDVPVFDRAQGARAESAARARRLRIALDAARRAAGVEVQAAFTAHARRAQAVETLEASALPLLDENESLARRSYQAGELGLAELLLIQRETLDTRREHLDRQLEAALAAVELLAGAGALE